MFVFVCMPRESGGVEEKNEAGAMSVNLVTRALALSILGLPGFDFLAPALAPPVCISLK